MERIKEKTIQKYEIEHSEKIRENAAECCVLLKKDGKFPLNRPGKIAVFGNGVRYTVKGGTGSGDVNIRHLINIEEGLLSSGFEITSKKWLDQYDEIRNACKKEFFNGLKEAAEKAGYPVSVAAIGQVLPEPEYELPLDTEGDTAVYVLSRNSGESKDREKKKGDLLLTDAECRDILALNEKYEKFMLVLNVGGMVELAPVKDVKNILLLGQLGTPTGEVLADILLGKSVPSGKLAMTWDHIENYPSTDHFGVMDDNEYTDRFYVGYRYFDKVKYTAAYPFGFGLSYTEFDIKFKEFKVERQKAKVTANVVNKGAYKGKEVLQLYVAPENVNSERPLKELVSFKKSKELKPGDSCSVELTFSLSDLACFCEEQHAFIIEQGEYDVLLGNSSVNVSCIGKIVAEHDILLKEVKNLFTDSNREEMVKGLSLKNFANEYADEHVKSFLIDADEFTAACCRNTENEPALVRAEKTYQWKDFKEGRCSLEELAAGMSDEELIQLCMGVGQELEDLSNVIGCASVHVAGASGDTTDKLIDTYGIPSISCVDGPAGVRISPEYIVDENGVKATGMAFGKEIADLMDEKELDEMKALMAIDNSEKEDVYYQYCTAIPIGSDIAQSFNEETAEIFGDIVGSEMERFGASVLLAPGMNIQRSPMCGRNFEYYSEDPVLTGKMGAAITRAVQKHKGCAVTIKHFACNNQETNRIGSNSIVDERTLRELYLKGFEICIKEAAPAAIMSSYNLLNGIHTCNRKDLLNDLLRSEWGYEGVVMTDWFVTQEIMRMPGAKYATASAAGCIKAGNNLIMPGNSGDRKDIMAALQDEKHPYHIERKDLLMSAVKVLQLIAYCQA